VDRLELIDSYQEVAPMKKPLKNAEHSQTNGLKAPDFLQSVLDALSAHVAVLDESGMIVATNSAWRRYAESNGLEYADWGIGANYLDVCERAIGECSEEADDVAKHLRLILEKKSQRYYREYPCHSPNERRWFQLRLSSFEDNAGHKVVVSHESVTELKKAEEAVRASEERFRAVFESAQDFIFIKDRDLAFRHVNPAVERFLGIKAEKIVGLSAEDLFGPQAGKHIQEVDRRVLAGQTVEEEFTRPVNGTDITFHDTRVPLRNEAGETVGVCVISRDVTTRSRALRPTVPIDADSTSAAMDATLKKAKRAASSDSIILLLGESGSGKDHMARWIHQQSKRALGPYFSINCAAVSKELAESELFGHESGAFTGARTRKKGLLELAEGGTLLLNEIGELPLTLQAKLLTFLDTKSFLRVGGSKNIHINARLITATHRNLETEVAEGRFLEPLFYRINVFMIRIPPLRDRLEDIPVIAQDLISKLGTDLQLTYVPDIDAAALTALSHYHWPGNIRELRNVLERSLMLSDSGRLNVDLPAAEDRFRKNNLNVILRRDRNLRDCLDEVTKFLLLEALRNTGGNARTAAQLLGISRDSIYRHFKRLGINREVRTLLDT
jgi:PAS domain S-box-containing protein